ncbi:MAG: pirin family protein [Chitinophagia bacterium]|nr:pirin family protein [Chitinophagia bacterium]
MAKTIFHAADTRGHADHGWLNAHHSFSFAGYYNPERVHFGALRVLNDDIVKGGMGFGKHPHDNMEIITIVLDGELAHKDSMGHTQTITNDEVQVMSAGTGVFHSEFNPDHHQAVNLLQTWILPAKKNIPPSYAQAIFNPDDRKNKLQTLVSPVERGEGGLTINQDAWIYRSATDAGHSVSVTPHTEGHGLYVFVISGSITAEGQQLNRRDALGIWETNQPVTIAANSDADFVVFEVPMQF